MAGHFKKESPKFDEVNYESWKEKMKTRLLCMGLGYWLITKNGKATIEERKLEECIEVERYFLMYIKLVKEALLSSLPKKVYSQVKSIVRFRNLFSSEI